MAAPSTAGRVFTLCKQFLNVVRISSAVNTRLCPANASKFQSPLNSSQVGFQCLLCSGMTTGQGVFIGMLRRDECYHHHISAVRIRSSSLAILFSATIFQFTINHRTSDFKKLVQPARVPSADVSSLKHDRKQVESICKLINNPTIAGFNVWVEKERKGSAMDGKELNIFEIHNGQLSIKREKSILPGLTWYTPTSYVGQCRALHTTISRRGLEDFFDLPENWGETNVKSGAPWTAKQLRTKSNEDLHKLWYVLLKERNMLLTLEQEARRQRVQMPSPERIRKIERSMIRLETVVKERETALRLLQTGQEKGRPGAWRRNVFGYVYWYRFKEYAIPWFMNRNYRRKKFYTPKFVEPHIRLRIEKYLRAKSRKANLEKKTQAKLNEKFPPQMKVSAS